MSSQKDSELVKLKIQLDQATADNEKLTNELDQLKSQMTKPEDVQNIKDQIEKLKSENQRLIETSEAESNKMVSCHCLSKSWIRLRLTLIVRQ